MEYTKWKFPNLPLNQKIHELLVSDLAHSRFATLRDVDLAIDAATGAVETYRKENPGVFQSGTDFITKSLGFIDENFRGRHPFSPRTREAFSKYYHLVRSEIAQDQEIIDAPPTGAAGTSLRHPTIVAAIIGAMGAVLAALSPWFVGQISGGGNPPDQETPDQTPTMQLEAPATDEAVTFPAAMPDEVEEFRDCNGCPLMIALPAETFKMGSTEAERQWAVDQGLPPERVSSEAEQHDVEIKHPFAISKHEVTFDQWDFCVADGGCNGYEPNHPDSGGGGEPVVNVSWDDAKAYVEWLSKVTGRPYRLPSEAEWEYTARAGTSWRFWWGDEAPTPDRANFGSNLGQTTEVGSYPVNPWGLADMNGNVWEWVEDCWNNSYEGAPKDGLAWATGDCSRRVLRGGSWKSGPEDLRSANRSTYPTRYRNLNLGFRVATTLSRG